MIYSKRALENRLNLDFYYKLDFPNIQSIVYDQITASIRLHTKKLNILFYKMLTQFSQMK